MNGDPAEPLVGIGLDHTHEYWLRQLALEPDAADALARRAAGLVEVDEAVVLATCNRAELYVSGRAANPALLGELLASAATMQDGHEIPFGAWRGRDAVAHLARVACGLESMVVGESEIQGQVGAALHRALDCGTAGAGLRQAFQTALRAGRRARSETHIGRNATSVAAVAINHVARTYPDLATRSVVVVGTGTTAELALKALRRHGCRDLTIVSRSAGRARERAGHWGIRGVTVADLAETISGATLLVCAGVTAGLVDRQLLASVPGGPPRALQIIDLGAPANVAEDVAGMAGIGVSAIADFSDDAEQALGRRRQEVPRVEEIIAEEVTAYEGEVLKARAHPLISDLRSRAETIRRRELERALRALPDLDDAARDRVAKLTVTLVNSILHEPTEKLRAAVEGDGWHEHQRVTRNLFGLSDGR